MNRPNKPRPRKVKPEVIPTCPDHVKPETLPAATHDDRYQCARDARPFGAGFSAVGVGCNIETGKAW